jgi:CRISPR-associated protein (Cas_Cas02710)
MNQKPPQTRISYFLTQISNTLQLGRVFRRLGLPPWTFAGIGLTSIWFNYLGALLEKLLRDGLRLNASPTTPADYIPGILVFLTPFIVLIAIALFQKKQRAYPGLLSHLQQPEGKRGLILLVSNPNSASFAIEYHLKKGTLESVWLLPSDGSDEREFGSGTYPIAQAIQQNAQTLMAKYKRQIQVNIHRTGVSPSDSQDTFDAVNRIFRQSGYEPYEVIADFTGGTKPMTAGMIMACLPAERQLEYVSYTVADQRSHGPFLVDYQHKAFDLMS